MPQRLSTTCVDDTNSMAKVLQTGTQNMHKKDQLKYCQKNTMVLMLCAYKNPWTETPNKHIIEASELLRFARSAQGGSENNVTAALFSSLNFLASSQKRNLIKFSYFRLGEIDKSPGRRCWCWLIQTKIPSHPMNESLVGE